MRIKKIEIDGFGVWKGLTLEELSDQATVIHGPNEAGKTTLMQFVRAVLYGLTPERRKRYLPPVHGGQPGGQLQVANEFGSFRLERAGERPESIGRLRSFVGNTGVLVRAYTYITAHGASGLREVSDDAVLGANYLKHRLAGTYDIPYDRACKHEFVASAASLRRETGVRTLDIAKRLIDHGFHPPTVYFPLITEEGMLIEPTETESVETMDAFADALITIAAEARSDPATVTSAPHTAPVRRLDEATAARQPNLRWRPMTGAETPCPD